MITAPFNFVPLSEKVFFPDWSKKVSHDVPFEDAQSGSIEITMTAKSPIFVRDGVDEQDFCHHKGTHYIPASSVKGMARNVLEIMSFSKMSMLDDSTYAVRDLSSAQNFYMKQMNLIDEPVTRVGWLKKIGDEYLIEDCGIPGRIHHKQIDYAFNVEFSKYFEPENFNAKNQKEKSSEYKYEKLGYLLPEIKIGDKYSSETNSKYDKREFYKFKADGKKATLVLTGQPTPRENTGNKRDGKGFEFLFFDKIIELNIDNDVVDNFKFAYFHDRATEPKESPDWTYWKKKLENGGKVPVFFQKNGKEVAHFGLSYLYKLPYSHSVKDGLPPAHNDARKDLAQTIFGYIGDDEALKGRVQFSHFKAVANDKKLEPRTEILGTPRASYYPIYVKQYDGKLFKTFMDGDFEIAGWKRYPIHSGSKPVKTTDTGNENVGTTFKPLKEGVVFQGKVRYHNLKKAELGALLSALTFHNTEGCFHNIGMAKSLGYGKIELALGDVEGLEELLKAFESEISVQVTNWSETQQLKELLTMATDQQNSGNSELKYMELPHFAENKKNDSKDYLRNYTLLDNIQTIEPESLIIEADLKELTERQEQYGEQEKQYLDMLKRQEREKKEWEIVYNSSNIATIEAFILRYPNSRYIKTAQEKIDELNAKADKARQEEAKKEAKEKWKAVQRVDKKYYKKALENFVSKYPDSDYAEEAKGVMESLSTNDNKNTKSEKLTLKNISNDIDLFNYLQNNRSNLDDQLEALQECIKPIYEKLDSKNKKNKFIKSINNSAYKNFSDKMDLN